jgi:hypothetical protein
MAGSNAGGREMYETPKRSASEGSIGKGWRSRKRNTVRAVTVAVTVAIAAVVVPRTTQRRGSDA